MRNGINKLAKILIISINKDKVTVTNMKIGSSMTKEDFLAILRRWFEN